MMPKEISTNPSRSKQRLEHAVRFKSSVDIISLLDIPSSSVMTEEEKSIAWYSSNELRNLRSDAKKACKRILFQHRRSNSNTFQKPQHELVAEDEECTRGLEYHVDIQRQKRNHLAKRCILDCQRRLCARASSPSTNSSDRAFFLAYRSQKASLWARNIAMSTGQKDFL
eukprot:2998915-Ditylum_brightwellii.AAC.1